MYGGMQQPAGNGLPPPWQVGTDQATGRQYYYNISTGVSQWEAPKWETPQQPVQQMVPQPQIQLQQQMQMQQQMQQQMQPQMQQMQMQMHQQMPYMGSQASGYQDSRDSYGGDSYRSGGGGGGGGGYGGSSSYGSQSQGGRGGSGRPFQDISNLPPDDQSKVRPEIVEWRRRNEITVAGDCPDPFLSFEQAPIPPQIMACIRTAGFQTPSVIQAQAWPPALKQRDVVGVAKTGSGKTLGFLFPGFLHILNLGSRVNPRNGPSILVLAPTRELADQIHQEAVKFGRSSNIMSACVYGGAPKGPQLRDLRMGAHVVIATPGRLNDFLEGRQVSLSQVSYLVFDEADRMLDMGFEPQIRKIVAQIPSQRQTLFFTATWPREVRKLASEFLSNPAIVYIGNTDQLVANKDVTQIVKVIDDMRGEKDSLVQEIIRNEGHGARIIIFCSTKRMCDQLERSMSRLVPCSAIHGDKDQNERNRTLNDFKAGTRPIMIATDVAARGLDVKDVKAVINYDFPGNVEDYVHRIGRTGRAGAKGTAYTFFTRKDAGKASSLVKIMEQAGQQIPPELLNMSRGGGQVYGSTMQFSSGGGGGGGGGYGRGSDFGSSSRDSYGGGSSRDARDSRDSRDKDKDRGYSRRRSRSRSRSRRSRSRSRSGRRSRSRSNDRRR